MTRLCLEAAWVFQMVRSCFLKRTAWTGHYHRMLGFCSRTNHGKLAIRIGFAFVTTTLVVACQRSETSSSVRAAELENEESMIDLGELTPQECRGPSQMATTVTVGDEQFPCRQLKTVQHQLAGLIAPSGWRAHYGKVGGDLGDADTRRQNFFGTYWSSYLTHPAYSDMTEAERHAAFELDLKAALPRLMAVLIASTHPTDVDDAIDDYWWELPWIYSQEPDLNLRAQMMRDDVNAWIQQSGVHMFRDVGTADEFVDSKIEGDFDFFVIEAITFLYQFRNRPDLLENDSVWVLLNKGAELDPISLVVPAKWTETNIPVSGQDFQSALWFGNHIAFADLSLAETENHVLMTMAHFYLANQWVSNDYRGNLVGSQAPQPPLGWSAEDWWSPDSAELVQTIRDISGRVVHSGMFEDNAMPYQQLSYLALLALQSYAEDPVVQAEAENALHFLATTFAFQSLEGRRWTPMRRNCEYAERLGMYAADGLAASMGILSGAYKWNDSPYGYKKATKSYDPSSSDGYELCMSDPSCHWKNYSFKYDVLGNDSRAERIPSNADELRDDVARPRTPQSRALYSGFAGYRLPRAVHGFMIDRHDGFYARMTPQYDRTHYGFSATEIVTPEYFDGDGAHDNPFWNNEKTPAFYFGTNSYLNASGGMYNSFFNLGENTHVIPANPLGPSCKGDDRLGGYDYLSRPYVILPQVPTVSEPGSDDFMRYEPFGLGDFTLSEARAVLPMMRGNSTEHFKSVNIATYKNFSYGYRVRDTGVAKWAHLAGDFPQDIPASWEETEPITFRIGVARFYIYDLRELMESRGQAGFFLITARVYKLEGTLWSDRVARGFWEVVPADMFANSSAIAETIKNDNPKEHFRIGYGAFHKDFKYKMATTGETLTLDQRFGAYLRDVPVADTGEIQGILRVDGAASTSFALETLFTNVFNAGHTNSLPLIDVKEVGEDLRFVETEEGSLRYYACAKDGWICVNNRHDGSYLWVDSRRGPGFSDNPYWEYGTFDGSPDEWGCACGSGDGEWTPGPPPNGIPDDCSDPAGCDGHDPGGDPQDCRGDCPTEHCEPSIECRSDSQCPSGKCDLGDGLCLCEDPGDGHDPGDRCEPLPTKICVPERPDCGPGEVCQQAADGASYCQCPECQTSSYQTCTTQVPCTMPGEECVLISDSSDVGQCVCKL